MPFVHKYIIADIRTVDFNGVCAVTLPRHAKILSYGFQGTLVVLWAEVEPGPFNTSLRYRLFLTGQEVDAAHGLQHVATVHDEHVSFVVHVYLITSSPPPREKGETPSARLVPPEELARCPIQSLSARHYREDGSCLCIPKTS